MDLCIFIIDLCIFVMDLCIFIITYLKTNYRVRPHASDFKNESRRDNFLSSGTLPVSSSFSIAGYQR